MSAYDDEPPPLASLPEQIDALRITPEIRQTSQPAVARVTIVNKASSRSSNGFRRGFLSSGLKDDADVKVNRKRNDQNHKQKEVIPFIKANNSVTKKAVPKEFILPPDETEQKLQDVKKELMNVLKPTPQVMQSITSDANLLNGFDDPEVMAAVADVAERPENFKKYQNNPKVMRFYQHMAKFAGQQLSAAGVGSQPTS